MSTILTDDERPELPMPRVIRGTNPNVYSDLDMEAYADAREAAVLAKLAQQSEKQCQHGAWIDCGICDKPHTHPAPQADRQRVPAGHVLVPVEPTIKQLAAMGPAIRACYELDGEKGNACDVYAAMLAAAPEAPAQASAVDERAEFEAWVTERGVAMHYEGDGHYGNATVARWWEAWQAHAAMAQKGGK